MDKAYLLYLFLSPSFFQVPCLYHLMLPPSWTIRRSSLFKRIYCSVCLSKGEGL